MFTATKDKALLTTTTGALPRPSWYTENLRGMPLSHGFSQQRLSRAAFRLPRLPLSRPSTAPASTSSSTATRGSTTTSPGAAGSATPPSGIEGIGAPRVEVPPAGFMADKGPGDLMWEVIETRMTPPVTGKIGKASLAARPRLQGDRADDRQAGEDRLDLGADPRADADRRALQATGSQLLMDLSAALNREYHALADAGAPLVQIEEPAIHQVIADPNQKIKPEQMGRGVQRRGERPARQDARCGATPAGAARRRSASPASDQSYKAALPYLDQLDVDVHHRRGRVQQRHGLRALSAR